MIKKLGYVLLIVNLCVLLNSCVKSTKKASSISVVKNPPIIGGTIQDQPLSLKNKVSVFIGKNGQTGSADGNVDTATFLTLWKITTNGKSLYVSDNSDGIRKIDLNTKQVTTIVNVNSQFSGITNNGIDIFAFDLVTNSIFKINIETNDVSVLAGRGVLSSIDGYGVNASFSIGMSMTYADGNLYLLEGDTTKLRKINTKTGLVSTIPGVTFSIPDGVTTDGKSLFITDVGDDKIYEINLSTNLQTIFYSATDLNAGITTDGKNLYFGENYIMKKVNISTGVITEIAGSVLGSQDGIGNLASFNIISGITSDGKKLYFNDWLNYTIRVIE